MPQILPLLLLSVHDALALLFAATALSKLRDLVHFRAVLDDYRLLPGPLVTPAAFGLIAAEISAAVLLALPEFAPLGAALAGLLFAGFSLAIAVNLLRGRTEISCGCGGGAESHLSIPVLLRSVLLLVVSALACLPHAATFTVAVQAFALGQALVLAALYLACNQLLANAAQLWPRAHHSEGGV